MATSAATVIAAMAARARREVREHFERNDAFEFDHAIPYDPPSRMHERQFDSMIGRGIVRDTGGGRYWIDREAVRLEEQRQRAAAILMMKLLLIGVALSLAVVAVVTALH